MCGRNFKAHPLAQTHSHTHKYTFSHALTLIDTHSPASRYTNWLMEDEEDGKFFAPVMTTLLNAMDDKNKRVQEAAVSAFATFEEAAGERLGMCV
jgi:arylsulfatase A-like enzyme